MTRTVGQIPVPAIDASTRRKITGGSVMTRSTKRIVTASVQRPASAEMAPTRKPMIAEIRVEATATSSEMRPPSRTRANTSRPTPSVPNQCVAVGPLFMARRSMSFGLNVHHSG